MSREAVTVPLSLCVICHTNTATETKTTSKNQILIDLKNNFNWPSHGKVYGLPIELKIQWNWWGLPRPSRAWSIYFADGI